MIALAAAGTLAAVRTARPSVLSLYLGIPLDPAGLRGVPAQADDLIVAAEDAAGGRVADEDRSTVRGKLEASGRDWLGRTVALFACADAGLLEAFPLPCPVADRAVLGIRPHVRPLLAAVQRCPAYLIVVADRVHARLFHVTGDEIEARTAPVAAAIRGAGSVGWHGLETHRMQQRAARLARRHYHDTGAMVEAAMAESIMIGGEPEPLVIGGHAEAVPQLLGSLPTGMRGRFAGSFAADARTITAARARELATPLVLRWASQHVAQLADEVLAMPPGSLTAAGLPECLDAVNARATATLIVPELGLAPGCECESCGTLSVDAGVCRDCGTSALPVPDLIEEMIARTLRDGGRAVPVPVVAGDGPVTIAARLRFPVVR